MKTILKMSALLLLAVSCAQKGSNVDPSRVVANPIDLNYAFHGASSGFGGGFGGYSPTGPYAYKLEEQQRARAAQQQRRGGVLPDGFVMPAGPRVDNSAGSRECADPVVEPYNGKYFLFPSKSRGYWYSEDMKDWKYVTSDILPLDLYAPCTMVYNGELYWMTSDINELYKTTTPEDGNSWKLVTDNLMPYPDDPGRTGHDPDLLPDDDGRVYLFWGCNNRDDIHGIELDPKNNFASVGNNVTLIRHMEAVYGWEHPGDKNETSNPGFNEGASAIKIGGKYYLQYASPGTEFDSYGDGLYVSDKPLGPYTHATYSPISVKPGGFLTGAGHGDTFIDKYGNYWHVASIVIAQRMNMERRIGFFPMILTEKGNLYAMTEFSDYPYILPDHKMDYTKESPWTGWMNLSLGKEISVSSTLDGHPASNASDNTIKSWWSASTGDAGEWICIDLDAVKSVNAIQTNFADEGFGMYDPDAPKSPYKYIVEVSKDGKSWTKVADKSDNNTDNPHSLIVLPKSVKARYVKITNCATLTGKFSVFDLRVFGLAKGKAPAEVASFKVNRGENRQRMTFTWDAVPGAKGYILHWGTVEGELYSSCESLTPEIELGMFSTDQDYYFRVDSFNESGLTVGKTVVHVD
ncbi:MAG: family 43 glycosylhydrolase [Bacteroidales bacterium]|nr:family 43 glycosylhydrolase [Bacteroidales bacterium]